MITFLNCSPRLEKSNSSYFIKDITERIDEKYNMFYLYKADFKDIISSIKNTEKIVLVFPLYVDSPPSKLLEFFEYVDKFKIKQNALIYAICQCGFLESIHNNIATNIIECFCINNGYEFAGAFKIGAGEVLGNSKLRNNFFIRYDYLKKLEKFTFNLCEGKRVNLETTIKFLTIREYSYIANINWKRKIKKYKKIGTKSKIAYEAH